MLTLMRTQSEVSPPPGCNLCSQFEGNVIWQNDFWRVLRVNDPDLPGYYRIATKAHFAELTHLPEDERFCLMQMLCAVEKVLLTLLNPTKINIASLGNKTPHVHWHVVPRFAWDRYYPDTIWSAPRSSRSERSSESELLRSGDSLDMRIARALNALHTMSD